MGILDPENPAATRASALRRRKALALGLSTYEPWQRMGAAELQAGGREESQALEREKLKQDLESSIAERALRERGLGLQSRNLDLQERRLDQPAISPEAQALKERELAVKERMAGTAERRLRGLEQRTAPRSPGAPLRRPPGAAQPPSGGGVEGLRSRLRARGIEGAGLEAETPEELPTPEGAGLPIEQAVYQPPTATDRMRGKLEQAVYGGPPPAGGLPLEDVRSKAETIGQLRKYGVTEPDEELMQYKGKELDALLKDLKGAKAKKPLKGKQPEAVKRAVENKQPAIETSAPPVAEEPVDREPEAPATEGGGLTPTPPKEGIEGPQVRRLARQSAASTVKKMTDFIRDWDKSHSPHEDLPGIGGARQAVGGNLARIGETATGSTGGGLGSAVGSAVGVLTTPLGQKMAETTDEGVRLQQYIYQLADQLIKARTGAQSSANEMHRIMTEYGLDPTRPDASQRTRVGISEMIKDLKREARIEDDENTLKLLGEDIYDPTTGYKNRGEEKTEDERKRIREKYGSLPWGAVGEPLRRLMKGNKRAD